MVDVKQVAIALDTSPLLKGEQALARLETAGRRTDASIAQLQGETQRLSGSMAGLSRANASAVTHQTAFGRATTAATTSVGNLTRTYDQATVRATAFGRATANAATQTQAAARGLTTAGAQAGRAGQQMNSAAGYTGNLAAQFNDIGVQLASGQSPLLLAVQQGTQINQVLAQMGRGGGAVRALGAAFTSILSPVSLLTIGIIAGGAALGQWALKAISAKVETRSLADLTEDLTDRTQSYQDAADSVLMSIDDQADAYGSLADEMRGVVEVQAELARGAAQEALDRLTASLGRGTEGGLLQRALAANPMTDVLQGFTGRDATERFFQIPAETTTRVEALLGGFRQMNEQLQEAKGNAAEQNRIMRQMVPLAKSLADEYGGITKQERAFLEGLTQAADQSARIVATTEEIVVSTTRVAEVSQRSLQWADQTLARMQAQTAASQTIAEYGANSAEVMDQQALAARSALAAELERRGIVGETAEALQAALVAQQEARVVAEERMRFDREVVRIEREKEQSAQRQLQLDQQRAHAEAAISQRLQNRIEVARAIVVHGKDSVQAKLAEEAVSRRLFELDLQRQGITGDTASQLRQQYENAVLLEGQIVQVQPAFQGIQSTVNGISQAWGEFVVSGFRDFRDFTRKVFDQFKQLLVQMIATAARNRIMFSMGIGGAGGAPMGGGGGGILGGLLGGGGGQGGGFLSSIGRMFGFGGGGGGGGGGLFGGITSGPFSQGGFSGLKNAAFNLGLLHGPAVAGGGAAAIASGAATSAAFGFGPAAGIGAGGLGAGGGTAAAAGLTGLGTAALAAGGIALVGLALMKSSKTIDRGAKILVEGLEATVEGYKTVETSQFFGLSKKTRDRHDFLPDVQQRAYQTLADTQISTTQIYSRILSLNLETLSDFNTELTVSNKNIANVEAEFAKIGDRMAQVALEANGLDVELEGAAQRLQALATSLAPVSRVLVNTGQQTQLPFNLAGAQMAESLIEGFGGRDEFAQKTAVFYREFFSEGERVANVQRDLNIAFRRAGVDTIPKTLQGFRDLANSQNLNTEAGRELYTTLIDLAPAFAQVTNFADEAAVSMARAGGALAERLREQEAAWDQRLDEAFGPDSRLTSKRLDEYFQIQSLASFEARNAFGVRRNIERTAGGQVFAVNPENGRRELLYDESNFNAERTGNAGIALAARLRDTYATSGRIPYGQLPSERRRLDLLRGSAIDTGPSLIGLSDRASFDRQFLPQRQQVARLGESFGDIFDNLGVAVPQSREAFQQLVDAQDLSTNAGRRMYNALIDMSGQFASLTPEIGEFNSNLEGTQALFRTMAEETFARSAIRLRPVESDDMGGGGRGGVVAAINAMRLDLHNAIVNGDIHNQRDLQRIIREYERDSYEPSTETVDTS